MNKHTPGPWQAKQNGFYRVAVVDRDGNYLTYKAGTDRMPDTEREANASLIAAAPDLLGALEQALDALAHCKADTGYSSTQHRAAIAASKAINKAKGL